MYNTNILILVLFIIVITTINIKECFNGFPFFENTTVHAFGTDLNAYNSYYPIDNSKIGSVVPTDHNTILDSNGFFKIKNKYGLLYPFYTDTENIIRIFNK